MKQTYCTLRLMGQQFDRATQKFRAISIITFFSFIAACGGASSTSQESVSASALSCTPTAARSDAQRSASLLASDVTGIDVDWKYQTGGRIYYAPTVMGDMVFTASEDNNVYAFKQKTGELVWKFEVPELIRDGSLLAQDGRITIASICGNVYSLDQTTGALLWKQTLGIDVVERPFLRDNTLYFSTTFNWTDIVITLSGKARLFALDADTGTIKWEFESDNFNLARPYVSDDKVLVGGSWAGGLDADEGGNNRIYALDLKSCETGSCEVLWTYKSQEGFPKSIYAYGGVVTYVGYRDFIYGLDEKTGEVLWRTNTRNWTQGFIYNDGVIYYGAANNILFAQDAVTGEFLWIYRTPEPFFNYPIEVPFIVGDIIYIFTIMDSHITALDLVTGEELWSYYSGIIPYSSEAVVAGDMLFTGSWDGNLYALKMN